MYACPSIIMIHSTSQTMHFHHDTHHAAYVNNLNNFLATPAAAGNTPLQHASLARIVMEVGNSYLGLNATQTTLVRNNAGGHFNHAMVRSIEHCLSSPSSQAI